MKHKTRAEDIEAREQRIAFKMKLCIDKLDDVAQRCDEISSSLDESDDDIPISVHDEEEDSLVVELAAVKQRARSAGR